LEDCKKQTHLIAHTMPHLAVDVLNKMPKRKSKQTNCWVMILKIGPFNVWSDAVSFLNLWTEKTRGKARRLERGLELYEMYRTEHDLQIWGQTHTREEMIEKYKESTLSSGDVVQPLPPPPAKRAKKNLAEPVKYEQLKRVFVVDDKDTTVQHLMNVHGEIEKNKS
jgi:hypothetical protein